MLRKTFGARGFIPQITLSIFKHLERHVTSAGGTAMGDVEMMTWICPECFEAVKKGNPIVVYYNDHSHFLECEHLHNPPADRLPRRRGRRRKRETSKG